MKISEIKKTVATLDTISFKLANGGYVPSSFHITEIGLVNKHFIDCGGTERSETLASFQLWNGNDTDHRLLPQKLLKIIELSKKILGDEDHEIEVEYQTETIGKYGLHFNGKAFLLTPKQTACLASDSCGTTMIKEKVQLNSLQTKETCCTPGGSCC